MIKHTENRDRIVSPADDQDVARSLEEVADLLEAQEANEFRVRAYRTAAEIVRSLPEPVSELLAREGLAGLVRLPGIGHSLARSIDALSQTKHLGLLDRLRGEAQGQDVLQTVPGIGPKLGMRIHDDLHIETLEDLELAAYDGRLAALSGVGHGRVQAVRESLAGRFRQHPRIPEGHRARHPEDEPDVAEILDVDREYRARERTRSLPRVAPRRFNPLHAAWLPILHTDRQGRHYTALYSNTARAHELGTTHDWVVIYRDDRGGDGQWTVITASRGPLRGKRIVRGREDECSRHYARRTVAPGEPIVSAS